ncbi:MAG: hypothetical protein IJM24_01870 [Clostridia bacterium]|nr:hypothetical protein [Clostridia bacterium]
MKKTSYKLNKKVLISILAVTLVAVLGVGVVFAYLSGKAPQPVKNQLTAEADPTASIEEGKTEIGTNDHFSTYDKNNVYVDISDIDYDVYVRAAVVVTWVKQNVDNTGALVWDNEGEPVVDRTNVHANLPVEGRDYVITYANLYSGDVDGLADDKWTKGSDGFYYYSSPVLKKAVTDDDGNTVNVRATLPLIASCHLNIEDRDAIQCPEGYVLNVEIVAQTIQAIGTTDADTYDAGTLAVVDAWKVMTKEYTPEASGDGEPETIVLIYKGLDDTNNNDPDPNNPGGELPDDGSDDEILP